MTETSAITKGVRRGLARHCPNCGQGRLFSGFLKVSDRCEVCGADNTVYPSDDAPTYLTMVLVCHICVPIIVWIGVAWAPPLWILFAISLPLIAAVSVGALPYIKGAVIGYAWATQVTRESVRT